MNIQLLLKNTIADNELVIQIYSKKKINIYEVFKTYKHYDKFKWKPLKTEKSSTLHFKIGDKDNQIQFLELTF